MDNLQRTRTRCVVVSISAGAVVGLSAACLMGIPRLVGPWTIPALISNAFSFWGFVVGAFAAVITATVTFAVLSRDSANPSRWARRFAGATFLLLAAGTWLWIAGWRVSPFTLEGLWIYPLASASTASAVFFLRQRRSGFWGEPPERQRQDR